MKKSKKMKFVREERKMKGRGASKTKIRNER
jgi:hypothetical protein